MKKVIVFAAMFLVLVGSMAVQAETIELKFAHFMSPKHIQHQKSFDPFTKKVAELTKGQVHIKIYPGGALGKPKRLPDAVKTGIFPLTRCSLTRWMTRGTAPDNYRTSCPLLGSHPPIHTPDQFL